MPSKTLTKESLLAWIDHYEQGNDLPDDIMQQVLYMAQRDVEKACLKEELDEMLIDEERYRFEQEEEFEDSDSVDAMHNIEHADHTLAVIRQKRKFLFGE